MVSGASAVNLKPVKFQGCRIFDAIDFILRVTQRQSQQLFYNAVNPCLPATMSTPQREDLDASLRATAGVLSVLRTLELGLELGKPSLEARGVAQHLNRNQYNYRRMHIHISDAIATVLAAENARMAVAFAGPFLEDDTLTVELTACGAATGSRRKEEETEYGHIEATRGDSKYSTDSGAGDPVDLACRLHGRSLPLQHHIYTLNNSIDSFLASPDEKSRAKAWKWVMKYVVASSSGKMHRRVTSSFSSTFLNNILALPKPSSITVPFHESRCLDANQKARDRLFLTRFHDPVFLRKLGSLQFPNLTKLGHITLPKPTPFTLYSPQTCDEIHDLLCFLISPDGFVGRLDRLVVLMEDHIKAIHESPSESIPLPPELYKTCSAVTTLGMVLRDLIYSSAFEEHISRMLPHLQVSLPSLKDSKGAEGEEEDIMSEDDAEAELLNIYFNLDVHQVYIKWAQLQVSFFEALYTLRVALGDIMSSGAKGGRKCKVSIKTLITPSWYCGVDEGQLRMDTWRQVFKDCLPSVATDRSGDFSSVNAIRLFEHLLEEGALIDDLGDSSPLSKGIATFHGRVHSEACLASLMCGPDSGNWDQLFHCTSSAIGLSHACCNVCSAFLSTLCNSDGQKIKVRPPQKVSGSPCNLPPWVPDHLAMATLLHLRKEVYCSVNTFFTQHIASPSVSDTTCLSDSDVDADPEQVNS